MSDAVATAGEPLSVVIVDDHPTFREGLRSLLAGQDGLDVVAECSDGESAVDAATQLAPDVVIMDLLMPGIGGVEATRRIVSTSPGTRVLVLTMSDADDSVFAALRAGARGYLLKEARPDHIVGAVLNVGSGQGVFGAQVASRISAFFGSGDALQVRPFPELSDRERQVLDLLAAGSNNAAIANSLGVSSKTVRNHVSNVLMKLQVADRAQAVARARDAGLGRGS